MSFLPDDQRITDSGGTYDPVFWSMAITLTLALWGCVLHSADPMVQTFTALVCVVLVGCLSAIWSEAAGLGTVVLRSVAFLD